MAVIEAITSGEDPSPAFAAADAEFQRANNDGRLRINAVTSINPSGVDPRPIRSRALGTSSVLEWRAVTLTDVLPRR